MYYNNNNETLIKHEPLVYIRARCAAQEGGKKHLDQDNTSKNNNNKTKQQ